MTSEKLLNALAALRTMQRRKSHIVIYNPETDSYHEAKEAMFSEIDGLFIITT